MTLNDSGSGMFFEYLGNWYLSGIGFAVDVNGSSFYDREAETAGDQPDRSFFVRISTYHSQISAALSVIPEPGTGSLLGIAGLLIFLLRRWSGKR